MEENKEELQTTFDKEDEFLQACLDDEDVEVILKNEKPTNEDGVGALYTPRLSAPAYSNKNWIHYTAGGYNYCIKIKGSSCLPNCVGYAWGRWREILGEFHKLSRANAEMWYLNTGDGYQRGQTPKVGAVMCWRKGTAGNAEDGAGHVAIVEEVLGDGRVRTSESSYGGTRFFTAIRKYPYHVGRNYYFQGFIYNPLNFDPIPEPPKPEPVYKFNVGDEVVINGPLYTNANASSPAGNVSNKVTTITRRVNGAHPYNTTGDLGWMNEDNIQKYIKPTPAPLKVGDRVKIVGTGNGSSYGSSNVAYGIGWERQVLNIFAGRAYPYQIGNASGVTGYYTANALERL